ncbi:MAG: protoporphyrinogen oxidase [Actinobacteria bacterium]|nr:MAG: protoporphyrinogen oxidase [Actinomycetota bacterium]
MSRRVVVVGAGITGLTVAYRMLRSPYTVEVLVVETDREPGGVIRSVRVGDLDLEAGPDALLVRKPWALDLCYELGLEGELVPQGATASQVLTPRGLLPVPSGRLGIPASATGLVRWKGMPVAARLRAMAEPLVPRRHSERDTSVAALLRRRLGRGATEALVAPLLAGIYAGDIDRLSVEAAFPELALWERELGSLRAGARAKAVPVRRVPAGPTTPFATIRGGLHRLPAALAEALEPGTLRFGATVVKLGREERGPYRVATDDGDDLPADAVVLATPASVSAELLAEVAPRAAQLIRQISAASTAIALFVYPKGTNRRLPEAAGFVTRRGALPITAATAISKKWPRQAFGSRAVVRAYVGGDGLEHELDRSDDEILSSARDTLAGVYRLTAEPEHAALVRWPGSMPQYAVGHLERLGAIEAALPPGLYVAGGAYRGAGIPDRVREAGAVADRVVRQD